MICGVVIDVAGKEEHKSLTHFEFLRMCDRCIPYRKIVRLFFVYSASNFDGFVIAGKRFLSIFDPFPDPLHEKINGNNELNSKISRAESAENQSIKPFADFQHPS